MADYFTKLAIQFETTASEAVILSVILNTDWEGTGVSVPQELIELIPEKAKFINSIFTNEKWPHFGIEYCNYENGEMYIGAYECPDVEAIAKAIQISCPNSLRLSAVAFEWSHDCTKLRTGAFGGGWCLIEADSHSSEFTSERLAKVRYDRMTRSAD